MGRLKRPRRLESGLKYWLWVRKRTAIGPLTVDELVILSRLPAEVALVAWLGWRSRRVAA